MADGIMTVEWSTSSEWVLITGGCDGAIRFWDIRRAGCFLLLDQSRSQLGRRPPLLDHSVQNKVYSQCFFLSVNMVLYLHLLSKRIPTLHLFYRIWMPNNILNTWLLLLVIEYLAQRLLCTLLSAL